MGTRYQHLTIEERCELARLRAEGHSVRHVAASLDRSPSTVARELRRNGSKTQGYWPSYAQQQARARRWQGSRLDRDHLLREQVLARLHQGWSPQQVAGRFALESERTVISHETIYRFIYAQLARTKNYNWRHYLPKAKSKRGWRGRRGGSPASFIAHRRPLSQRTEEADDRTFPGHWEADLMLFGNHGQALLVLQEGHSRLLATARVPGKAAEPVARALAGLLAPFPAGWRRTVAFWTTAPSSPGITNSMNWVSKPSSAMSAPPGRRAGWKTASAGCPAGRICRRCRTRGWPKWPRPTTTPHAGAWGTSLPLKSIPIRCCT